MKPNITTDLSKFYKNEFDYKELLHLLKTLDKHGLPWYFAHSDINFIPGMDLDSGDLVLVGEQLEETIVLKQQYSDSFEQWHYCKHCDNQGYIEDFKENIKDCCKSVDPETGEHFNKHDVENEKGQD